MNLTIVMYHYVRDLARSRYPSIKGRDVASFQFQLDHIARNYSVVTVAQILEALRGGRQLPDNAAWLTFDDGYLDHYTVACVVSRIIGKKLTARRDMIQHQ